MFFLLGFFLNYFIQPFDVNTSEHKLDYFWIAVIHSLSPLVVLWLLSFITQKWIINIDGWSLKKELVFALGILLLVGLAQFLLRDLIYVNPLNWSYHYFFEEVINTLLAGSLLAVLVISVNLNLQFFKNSERALVINNLIKEPKSLQDNIPVLIETDVKAESFTLHSNELIFVKAEGNYIKVWMLDENSSKSILKRITLKEFGSKLYNLPNIIQVHRSYILNTNFIDKVSGNAQGYKISLKNCSEIIPVSRNYITNFNEHIEKNR